MGTFIRTVTKKSYANVAKPLLFKVAPDTVHTNIVSLGRKTNKSKAVRGLMKLSWHFKDSSLVQIIHGLEYANPVGLAAGFDKNVQLTPMLEAIGFGFTTGGSVTGEYCMGNPRPWFHRLPEQSALVVHAGLANNGCESIGRALAKARRKNLPVAPVSISVARTNSKQASTLDEGVYDYVKSLNTLRAYPDMFEINISCPNTYGGEPYTTPSSLDTLLTAIDALQLTQPVYIKMPSDLSWPKFNKLLDVITRHNVKGVTICNLLKNRQGLAVSDDIPGGISGRPVQALSDELIAQTYKKCGDSLTIIGVGGIFTAEDAYRKIKNGASLVALVTGLIYEGPQIVGEINSGLAKLLKADGYKNISEAKGTAVK